jgi:hypothetical protein
MREPLVRGSGTAAGNGGGNEGDVGEMDERTKMILSFLRYPEEVAGKGTRRMGSC